jgi:hypothetical protein
VIAILLAILLIALVARSCAGSTSTTVVTQRKCVKGHPKADGKCSGRCIRYYPRLELPRGAEGQRRFEALGG